MNWVRWLETWNQGFHLQMLCLTSLHCCAWFGGLSLTPQAGTVEKLHDFEQALEDQQAQLKPPRGEEQDGHQAWGLGVAWAVRASPHSTSQAWDDHNQPHIKHTSGLNPISWGQGGATHFTQPKPPWVCAFPQCPHALQVPYTERALPGLRHIQLNLFQE